MSKQKTTNEFSARLQSAIEGHPLAPPTPHGRQKCLQEKLLKEAELEVSANTVSKWVNGMARPRPDSIRLLPPVLSVDEVWLALGRKPGATTDTRKALEAEASGAILVLAGLIEMAGGRVAFLNDDDQAAQITVNMGGSTRDLVVVTPQRPGGDKMSFVVPEPVGDACVIAVLNRPDSDTSACVDLLDLTDCERQNFGGFSVVEVERRKGGRYKIGSARSRVTLSARFGRSRPDLVETVVARQAPRFPSAPCWW